MFQFQLAQLSLQIQHHHPMVTCGLFVFDWPLLFTVRIEINWIQISSKYALNLFIVQSICELHDDFRWGRPWQLTSPSLLILNMEAQRENNKMRMEQTHGNGTVKIEKNEFNMNLANIYQMYNNSSKLIHMK